MTTLIYTPEKIIVINLLIHWHCLKEDDIINLSKLGRKLVCQALAHLEKDKFVKTKEMFVRTDTANDPLEKRQKIKIRFYFINYKSIINMITYKKYRMAQEAEKECIHNAAKAAYHCSEPTCKKEFTELDMNVLNRGGFASAFNGFEEDRLTCDYCGSEVIEDKKEQRDDMRLLPQTLNDRFKWVNRVIEEELQFITLKPQLVDPPRPEVIPKKYLELIEKSKDKDRVQKLVSGGLVQLDARTGKLGSSAVQKPAGSTEEMWRTGKDYNIEQTDLSQIEIEILSNAELKKARMEKSTAKEVPIWMRQSTIKGAEEDAFKPEDRIKQFQLFLDDMKDDDDLLDDDLEDEDESELTAKKRAEKKKNKMQGRGRWWHKNKEEVVAVLREHEKINEDSDHEDGEDSDSDGETTRFLEFTGNGDFMWPIVDLGHGLQIGYDKLLKYPHLVEKLNPQQKQRYQYFADRHNISFMF